MGDSWPAMQRRDVDRVLRRAIELESRGGEWMEGERLRDIARQLDLDPRPVEQAIREFGTPSEAGAGGARLRRGARGSGAGGPGAAARRRGLHRRRHGAVVRARPGARGAGAGGGEPDRLDRIAVGVLVHGLLIGIALIAASFLSILPSALVHRYRGGRTR